jgi:multisubunit Na+/H+ antiporter MnhB subunit
LSAVLHIVDLFRFYVPPWVVVGLGSVPLLGGILWLIFWRRVRDYFVDSSRSIWRGVEFDRYTASVTTVITGAAVTLVGLALTAFAVIGILTNAPVGPSS